MADRSADQAAHVAAITLAKDQLGMVAPDWRGELARYLDLGEAPRSLLCAVIDNMLTGLMFREEHAEFCARPEDVGCVVAWLECFVPGDAYGSRSTRLEWQERVSKLVAARATDDEEAAE